MASIEMKSRTKESDEGKKEQEMKDKQYELAKNKMHIAFKKYKTHLSNEPLPQKIDQGSAHEDDFYYPEKIEWDNQKKKLFDDATSNWKDVKDHEDNRETNAANRAAQKTSSWFFGLGKKKKSVGPDGESIVLEGGRKTRKHKKRRKHKKHRRTKRKHHRTKRKHHKKKRKTRKHKKKVVKRKRR